MDDNWSGNSFLSGSLNLNPSLTMLVTPAVAHYFTTYLLTTHKQFVSRQVGRQVGKQIGSKSSLLLMCINPSSYLLSSYLFFQLSTYIGNVFPMTQLWMKLSIELTSGFISVTHCVRSKSHIYIYRQVGRKIGDDYQLGMQMVYTRVLGGYLTWPVRMAGSDSH